MSSPTPAAASSVKVGKKLRSEGLRGRGDEEPRIRIRT